jgi:hypothetical protein
MTTFYTGTPWPACTQRLLTRNLKQLALATNIVVDSEVSVAAGFGREQAVFLLHHHFDWRIVKVCVNCFLASCVVIDALLCTGTYKSGCPFLDVWIASLVALFLIFTK